MAAKKKKQAVAKPSKKAAVEGPIQMTWSLDELPSSQHKTGLVGLALLVQWMTKEAKKRAKGVLKLLKLDADVLTLEFDLDGLRWLFDEAYAAAIVEIESKSLREGEKPIRIVQREEITKRRSGKDGKPQAKTVKSYVYADLQPSGAFLEDLDPAGNAGAWIKLWRDHLWSVVRAQYTTRLAFLRRANGDTTTDAEDAYASFDGNGESGARLPGGYLVGAQAATAEDVPFRDRSRLQFLLQFWPFAVGIAVPSVADREGKTRFTGFALSFPDVADLEVFVNEYRRVLESRTADTLAYLPRQAVLDLPAEAGLQFLQALRTRMKASESRKRTLDLVLGVDVFHVEREGNNVRTRWSGRVEPDELQQDEYERIRTSFRDPLFRRQLLVNLIEGREWTTGFDRLFATMPSTHFLRGKREADAWPSMFPNDVKTHLSRFNPSEGAANE